MDAVDFQVHSIIFREARRAYGYTPADERPQPPVCRDCGGDGCKQCDYTGDAA